jgi:dihydrofolate reductase
MHVSLDGFVAGPNGEIDWVRFDDDLVEDVQALVDSADTALFGRVTYRLMESYWPTAAESPTASKHDLDHSRLAQSRTQDSILHNPEKRSLAEYENCQRSYRRRNC